LSFKGALDLLNAFAETLPQRGVHAGNWRVARRICSLAWPD
jgi:hypothetical protein